MSDSKYFVIPFDRVPTNPGYTVWFASWTTERPSPEPNAPAPLAVGVTSGELPVGATLLAAGGKDPPPPPPPLGLPNVNLDGAAGLPSCMTAWLTGGRDV